MTSPLTKPAEGKFILRRVDGSRSGSTYHLRRECPSALTWVDEAEPVEMIDLATISDIMTDDDLVKLMNLSECKACRQWQELPQSEDAVRYGFKMADLYGYFDGVNPQEPADEAEVQAFLVALASVGFKVHKMTAKERKEAGLDW